MEPARVDYCIKDGYVERAAPDYFVDIDPETGLICQPDVYIDASRIGEALGATRMIDIGCGNGFKLNELHPRYEIIGIDFGENLDTCRADYPHGEWRHHDLETEDPLPVSDEELAGAIVICSDVVEHLVRPELLLRKLKYALQYADAVLISTPERELTWGPDHFGPPPNPHHVREWSAEEFAAFLESEDLDLGDVGLTRNNNQHNELNNILAVLYPDEARMQRVDAALGRAA
jgi:SAM-dependent methyltransferase